MAGDVLEEDSSRQLSLNVRPQRAQQLAARAQLLAEPGRVEPVQQPGRVVRGAAAHGAVRLDAVRGGFFLRGDAAHDAHRPLRALALAPVRTVVTPRRDWERVVCGKDV